MKFLGKASVAYAGGAVAAVIAAAAGWLIIYYGLADKLHISMPIPMSDHDVMLVLYRYVFWGGIIALLFALPLLAKASWWKRGLVLGLVPTLITLFVIFPVINDVGMFGTGYGNYTFVLVLIVNWIWGLIAAAWYQGFA